MLHPNRTERGNCFHGEGFVQPVNKDGDLRGRSRTGTKSCVERSLRTYIAF